MSSSLTRFVHLGGNETESTKKSEDSNISHIAMIIRTITLLVCLQRFVRASKTMTLGSSRLRGSHPGDQRGLQGPGYSDAELQYFRECEDSLLGETVIADGLISQEEFASAYASFCAEYAASSRGCPSSSFDSLPKGIQDNFFQAVCETMPDPARCATNLRSLNTMPFGYIVSDETMPKVQMQVQGLCLMLLDDVFGKLKSVVQLDIEKSKSDIVIL